MLSSAASACLHAVDDRELGGALLALLVEALRLVEEARVLEAHAHAAGERLQQAHVGLAEGVLALEVGEVDHAPTCRRKSADT
jgi:hypothetical protein